MLTTTRRGMLTIGVVLCVYFSSSGVESLRIGAQPRLRVKERAMVVLRLESIAYVLVGARSAARPRFLVVLGPLIFRNRRRYAPGLTPLEGWITIARFASPRWC